MSSFSSFSQAAPQASSLVSTDLREKDLKLSESCCDSDQSLLHRVATGDSEALSCLFGRYAKIAYEIARRILGDPTEADDCVQEIFVYFHRKAHVFNAERGNASSWIVQVMYHKALQYRMNLLLRSERSGLLVEDRVTEDLNPRAGTTAYERSMEWTVGRTKLREMLCSLSQDQWNTLRLHFFEGYTLSEIAKKTGQPLGNVRHHFYRGLEKLRGSVFRGASKGRMSSGKRSERTTS